jgi:N-acetylglutamate synthase-like GNAT family acetyltransferase
MNPSHLRIRRATTDDLPDLKPLWKSMCLPADDLEKRLTEFQVVEADDGQIAGAIGVQIIRQHALVHSESYTDFSVADAARQLFWERIQTLAAHHGVFRIWTRERSPFWVQLGLKSANTETLARLPAEWNRPGCEWFTFQLKDEEVIADALTKEFARFMTSEKQADQRLTDQARTLKTIIIVIGFAIGILCFGLAGYLLIHNTPFLRTR